VDDLSALSMDELRAKRAEAQTTEVGLSYLRRLAQGRLDIVAAEKRRRSEGGEPLDHDHLVAGLSDILGDHLKAPGNGRLPQLLGPDLDEVDTSSLDAIAGPGRIAKLADLSDGELGELLEQLASYEADVSARRRGLFEQIDALQAEITRRYKSGEASVETLLR
jgi:hypothetical protein